MTEPQMEVGSLGEAASHALAGRRLVIDELRGADSAAYLTVLWILLLVARAPLHLRRVQQAAIVVFVYEI